MLTVLALLAVVGGASLVAAVAARVTDGIERRRFRRIGAQVEVTDAIHGALGAVAAPTVTGGAATSWTVTMGLEPRDLALAGPLAAIAYQALGGAGARVRVVFTPRR